MLNIYQRIKFKICNYKTRADILRSLGVVIGENSEIYPSVNFGSEPYLIEIGNNVRITDNVKLTTYDGEIWALLNNGKLKNADRFGKIVVGNNVHIGIDSIIMPGVHIGDNVIIGAGSIVTRDIPSNTVAVGVPCKPIETIDEYYYKIKDKVLISKNMNYQQKKDFILKNIDKIK